VTPLDLACMHGLPPRRCTDCRPANPGANARPVGYLTLDQSARHTCEPPDHHGRDISRRPLGRIGTAWRCHCGHLWVIREYPPPTHGQVAADRRYWAPAGWLLRWRYRHARTADPAEVGALPPRLPGPPPRGPSGVSRSKEGER
jgi:hypothetical protein